LLKDFTIIDKGLVLLEKAKKKLLLNNHTIIGSYIMSLGRLRLYQMFYSLKARYKDKIKLNMCDTDSNLFTLEVENGQDVMKELSEIEIEPGQKLMDLSNTPIELRRNDIEYDLIRGVPGRAKLEVHEIIEEIAVLKKKAYAIKLRDCEKDIMKMKGLPHSHLRNCDIETYKDTIFKQNVKTVNLTMMKSLKLQLFHITMHRLAFSPICESRFLLSPYGVSSLPFGHNSIVNGERMTVMEESEEAEQQFSE
jgi:hypothetical protein